MAEPRPSCSSTWQSRRGGKPYVHERRHGARRGLFSAWRPCSPDRLGCHLGLAAAAAALLRAVARATPWARSGSRCCGGHVGRLRGPARRGASGQAARRRGRRGASTGRRRAPPNDDAGVEPPERRRVSIRPRPVGVVRVRRPPFSLTLRPSRSHRAPSATKSRAPSRRSATSGRGCTSSTPVVHVLRGRRRTGRRDRLRDARAAFSPSPRGYRRFSSSIPKSARANSRNGPAPRTGSLP